MIEPHAWGCTEVVVQYFAAFRYQRLGTVDGRELVSAGREDTFHVLQRHGALHQFAAEVFAQKFLCDVVLGWTESTGD